MGNYLDYGKIPSGADNFSPMISLVKIMFFNFNRGDGRFMNVTRR